MNQRMTPSALSRLAIIVFFAALATFAQGCARNGTFPDDCEALDVLPRIYPDYVETTFPPNIAPANYRIEEDGEAYATRFAWDDGSVSVFFGREVTIPVKRWRLLLEGVKGRGYAVETCVKRDGRWRKYKSFRNEISTDPIDSHLAYRLIEPGYDYGHRIALAERNLETFDERIFFDNRSSSSSPCLNCHSFQNRETERFLFHYRRTEDPTQGGTIVVDGDRAYKASGRVESAGLSCSYPAWRPTGDLVAFSSNQTRQIFHSLSTQKIEVFDAFSDLALFDPVKNELALVAATPSEMETFPSWSPDGAALYYSCATVQDEEIREKQKNVYESKLAPADKASSVEDLIETSSKKSSKLCYNIARRSFDEASRTFGEPETVVDAAANGRSALFARVSPDGNFLAYTVATGGTFPIWRQEADLYLKDLRTGEERRWSELNSDDSDSYHTWSSSGRWIVFSSRREDGQYTRPYFAHVDEKGVATKPFVLPQKDPQSNRRRYKSYNVPELIVEPIKINLRTLYDAAAKDPEPTKNLPTIEP